MTQDASHGRWGIVGGTILSILPNITSQEVFKTALLAALGAFVSYVVSKILKKIL